MVKAVIFDCFGVLIGKNFERTYRTAGGNPVRDRTFIEHTLGQANLGLISDDEFRATMAQKVGINSEDWSQVIKSTEQLNTALFDYIKQLRTTYKTAILSNANKGVIDRIIGEKWLEQYFDEVVVSAEVGIVKPDQRIYQLAADRLGVQTGECVYIDDRASFLDPARSLGMDALLYENFDQIKKGITKLLT